MAGVGLSILLPQGVQVIPLEYFLHKAILWVWWSRGHIRALVHPVTPQFPLPEGGFTLGGETTFPSTEGPIEGFYAKGDIELDFGPAELPVEVGFRGNQTYTVVVQEEIKVPFVEWDQLVPVYRFSHTGDDQDHVLVVDPVEMQKLREHHWREWAYEGAQFYGVKLSEVEVEEE